MVKHQDEVVGQVTSGVVSPTLQQSIAMAMVDTTWSNEGTTLQVEVDEAWRKPPSYRCRFTNGPEGRPSNQP